MTTFTKTFTIDTVIVPSYTVAFMNLDGDRENLDKTLRYTFESYWDSTSTNDITPWFKSDTEEPSQLSQQDNTSPNEIRCGLFGREKAELRDYNGDAVHGWIQKILIEIQAENLQTMTLFEDEVNRILWSYQPDTGVRLLKSDGLPSEAAEFMESEMEFQRVQPEGTEDQTPTSQGILSIVYYKKKY